MIQRVDGGRLRDGRGTHEPVSPVVGSRRRRRDRRRGTT